MKGTYADGKLVADPALAPSAGAFMATAGELKGTMRGRILPDVPLHQDFESFELPFKTGPGPNAGAPPPAAATPAAPAAVSPPQSVTANATTTTQNPGAGGESSRCPRRPAPVAAPIAPGPTNWNYIEPPTPSPIRRCRGMARDSISKFGRRPASRRTRRSARRSITSSSSARRSSSATPTLSNYTAEADVMTEGNKRKMSEVGLINQRYLIILKGNAQQLEVNSNQELFRASAPVQVDPE